jgi:DNA-3-methyladenine glycosylase
MPAGGGAPTLAPLRRRDLEIPVVELASALLGRLLVRHYRGGLRVGRIVETEAYGGLGVDPSAHSFRGPTPRCEVMFGPAGYSYVYATQGRCFCLNVSATGDESGKAVLIRALEPLAGVAVMRRRRLARLAPGPTARRLAAGRDHELAQGPGRLCVAFDVDRRLNGLDLCDPAGPLFLAAGEAPGSVRWTPRIGLNPASGSFRWRWRAVDADSDAVSIRPGRRSSAPSPAVCPAPAADAGPDSRR